MPSFSFPDSDTTMHTIIACSNLNTIHISLIAVRGWNSLLFRGSENCSQADIYSCDVLNTHLYIRSRMLPQPLIQLSKRSSKIMPTASSTRQRTYAGKWHLKSPTKSVFCGYMAALLFFPLFWLTVASVIIVSWHVCSTSK